MLESRLPEAIVLGAFGVVIKDIISLLDLFEFLRGVRRMVDVRVILFGQFPVGRFDFVFGRRFADAEEYIFLP